MTKRAILYARVSTDEQAEKGYSLPTQLEAGQKYAAEHEFIVVAEIQDDYSGAKLNRPGLDRLREMINRREADAVICYSVDRLTRNPGHAWELAETWHRAGIELHFCNRGQTEDTPEGTMTYGFESLFAYYYRAKTLEATKRGKLAKAKAGKWVGSGYPPYGYRREGKGETARLVIDEQEAKIVKRIFSMYVGCDGFPAVPFKAIARQLTEEGIKSPERNMKSKGWYPGTLKNVLTRRAYLGEFKYDGHVISLPELAIITPEVWNAAQARRDKNKVLCKRNQKRDYLLSGYFLCACGRTMAGNTQKPKAPKSFVYYRCTGQTVYGHLTECREKSLRAELAEALIWEKLKANLDPDRIEQAVKDEQARREAELEPNRERLALLGEGIAKAERKVKRLAADYAQALDESEDDEENAEAEALKEQMKMASRQRDALITERDTLTQYMTGREITSEYIRELKAAVIEIGANINNADFAGKRYILDRLEVGIKITYNEEGKRCLEMSYLLEPEPVMLPIESSSWGGGGFGSRTWSLLK